MLNRSTPSQLVSRDVLFLNKTFASRFKFAAASDRLISLNVSAEDAPGALRIWKLLFREVRLAVTKFNHESEIREATKYRINIMLRSESPKS